MSFKYRLNQAADCLSRRPGRALESEDSAEVAALFQTVAQTTEVPTELLQRSGSTQPHPSSVVVASVGNITALPSLSVNELRQHQEADPVLRYVMEGLRAGRTLDPRKGPEDCNLLVRQYGRLLIAEDGLLKRKITDPVHGAVLQVVLPQSLKSQILDSVHNKAGHQGVERKFRLTRQRVYWPRMWQDVQKYCQECERCNMAKLPQPKPKFPMSFIVAARPLEIVATDFTVLEKSSDGRESVLVITDCFTKFSQAIVKKDQSARTVAKCLIKERFSRFGVPLRLHSDQGKCFEASLIQEI